MIERDPSWSDAWIWTKLASGWLRPGEISGLDRVEAVRLQTPDPNLYKHHVVQSS